MSNEWRPKELKNPYDCSVCDTEPEGCHSCGTLAYESGINDTINILKENYTFQKVYDKDWYINRTKGTWVFIPDKG